MKKGQNKTQKRLLLYLLAGLASIVILLLFFKTSSKPTVQNPVTNTPSPTSENKNASLDQAEAVEKVRNLPEVKNYLKDVPGAKILVDHEEESAFVVQVFEVKDGHTNTFNWYSVDKITGAITPEFDITSTPGE